MKEVIINKTFEFGKIRLGRKRATFPAKVTLELRRNGLGMEVLSICGSALSPSGRVGTCGQCLDTLKRELAHDKTFMRLFRLWSGYHLNDLHAGTEKQEKALAEAGITEYDAACAYLKKKGLFVDELSGNERVCETESVSRTHFPYGHGWITRRLPADVLAEIYDLCGEMPKAATA